MLKVEPARLRDINGILELASRLDKSRFKAFVSASPEEAEAYLANSVMFPQNVGLLLLHWGGVICGMCALMAVDTPRPGQIGVYANPVKHCFIHSVYIDPYLPQGPVKLRVPPAAGIAMMQAVEKWARDRGAVYLYGNCRLDGNFGGFERKYGFKRVHYVIGKNLEAGNNG